MKIRDIRKGEIKSIYGYNCRDGKVFVKFSKNGKEYAYNENNVEILSAEAGTEKLSFTIYKLDKFCWKCKQKTSIYTYIVFDDGTNDDVVYPWDKERLLRNQNIFAHLEDPSIEYYGLKIVGDDEDLDKDLMEKFPDKIKINYSKTQNRSYPMNVCDHCKSIQGWNFVYRQVNELINDMKPIKIYSEIEVEK